mmetsp:Transcript_15393/g.36099  ORF Transcript_15393/g.36099 Transcript_15393/m.36099 type:complete len:202 (-) Transcript_15393:1068-1673(-)
MSGSHKLGEGLDNCSLLRYLMPCMMELHFHSIVEHGVDSLTLCHVFLRCIPGVERGCGTPARKVRWQHRREEGAPPPGWSYRSCHAAALAEANHAPSLHAFQGPEAFSVAIFILGLPGELEATAHLAPPLEGSSTGEARIGRARGLARGVDENPIQHRSHCSHERRHSHLHCVLVGSEAVQAEHLGSLKRRLWRSTGAREG